MENLLLPQEKFNEKRAGSLVGTITAVSEYLRLLYAMIGKCRDSSSRTFQGFSAKSSYGTCTSCNGTETVIDIDPARMIASELSLKHGAVLLWAGTICAPVFKIKALAKMIGIDYEKPLAEQDRRFMDILLYGYEQEPVSYVYKKKQATSFYRGCVTDLRYMRDAGTKSKGNLRAIRFFSKHVRCAACNGSKMAPELLAATIQGRSIVDTLRLPIQELLLFIRGLPHSLDVHELEVYSQVKDEIELRLVYLNKIGLKSLMIHEGE
ncbi:hypothetical protein [Paenibacillus harenae]|uniref:hypothetical protein n=1 Tax=Paenibacillus harenae TaxID=306543 RepID=UPI000492DDA7|nr:hypothetical protein [Paenibacillus harenae]